MTITIGLGGITFMGAADTDGDKFLVDEVDGFDSPEFELNLGQDMADGMMFESQRMKSRSMTISGMAYCVNAATVDTPWRLRKKLGDLLASMRNSGYLTMSVNEPTTGRAWIANVVPAQNPVQVKRNGPYAITFQINIVAPDPRKYSQSLSSAHLAGGASSIVANSGNIPAPWWATVFSASTDPGLHEVGSGAQLRTVGAMTTNWGISQYSRAIYDNSGVNRYDMWDPTSSWFYFPVGIFTIQALNGSNLDVYWRSAWL